MRSDNIPALLVALSRNKFRSSFRLRAKELEYVEQKGIAVIRSHAEDFIRQRLSSARPANDGRQTPMRGHPVFIAQHATATCCRKCLGKWHKIPAGAELTDQQIEYIVSVIMAWIDGQMQFN